MTAPFAEIVRFGIVGLTATTVHLALLTVGVEVLNARPVIMNGVSFCVAVGVTYFGQSLWVFPTKTPRTGHVARFAVSVLLGIAVNMLVMAVSVHALELPYLYGFIAGLILVPAMNFVLNKFWVFAS